MPRTQLGILRNLFVERSQATLVIDARDGSTLTYEEFLDQSLRMASVLEELGVGPHNQIVVSMENCVELAVLYFSCMHLGAEVVPVNPGAHARDFETALSNGQPKLALVSPAVRRRAGDVLGKFPVRVLCFRSQLERLKSATAAAINFDFNAELARHEPLPDVFARADDEDTLLVMMSSGTTGTPKGIELCYRGLIGNGRAMARQMGMDSESRFYDILPMTYLGGFYNLFLIPLLCGGSVVLDAAFGMPNMYAFWEVVRQHGINTLWFTPTMLSMLLSLAEDESPPPTSQIRLALCGMAPLPVELKRQFERRFECTLHENYGLSETLFITTSVPSRPYQDGSIGRLLSEVNLEIRGEGGTVLGVNAEGQIAVRTPYFMKGYRHADAADRANLGPDGYFLTGDIGYLDDQEELFISGRLKDLIIRGGVNISPKSLENVIHRLPGIQQVAVIGVPHSVYGEEVVAVVTLHEEFKDRLTSQDVKSHCEEQIASFERPKHVFVIDSMPLGMTGKVQKNVLRRLVQEKIDPLGGA
ncbi:MAG: acyl--CoA ligase [Planctomycetia bacterium]|nr:acyl--CoA ligase [Planctomycetia bacterium]